MTRELPPAGLDRIHRTVSRHVERGAAPGAVWLVSRGSHVVTGSVGHHRTDGGPPMARDSLFRISSLTKPLVAAAALSCVEDCLFDLDEPVDRLLPELADRWVLEHEDAPLGWVVPAERPILVRDLLTFTLGMGIVMAPPGEVPIADALVDLELGQGPPAPQTPPAPDEWMRRLGSLPLLDQPGTTWRYHTGADVLGVLLARAEGAPLDEVLRARILDPLDMPDTGFSVPASSLDRLVTAYRTDPATGRLDEHDPPGGEWSRPPVFPSGAGGLVSTADDIGAFGRMLLAGGDGPRGRVLSRASVATMTSDQLTVAQKAASRSLDGGWDARGWGFGLSVVTRRTDLAGSVGSYGWDGGLGTCWLNDPAEDLVTVLMTQAAWTSPTPPAICRDFRTSVWSGLDP